jgi:membrane protease YdiL (CAAX protease family)
LRLFDNLNMITKYPLIFRFTPALLLFVIGFFLSDGLLVELSISWVLLLLFEKKDPRVLGIVPSKARAVDLIVGFSIAASICAFNYYLQIVFSGSTWSLNKSFTPSNFFAGSWWAMRSVLYEELIFRGALLYIAINKIGAQKACLLSAVCFGIYHWFSMNALGNWGITAFLFFGTGIMGYVFALAYAKTKSLYLPTGLHFGWNFVNTIIFSQGPIGNQLLIIKRGEFFNVYENIVVMVVQYLALPVLAFLYIKLKKDFRL